MGSNWSEVVAKTARGYVSYRAVGKQTWGDSTEASRKGSTVDRV
jgi:hypothetical protein